MLEFLLLILWGTLTKYTFAHLCFGIQHSHQDQNQKKDRIRLKKSTMLLKWKAMQRGSVLTKVTAAVWWGLWAETPRASLLDGGESFELNTRTAL